MKFTRITVRLSVLPHLFFLSLLVSCGGGNNTKSSNKPPVKTNPANSAPSSGASSVTPHEKCSVIVTGDYGGVSYEITSESDYSGNIKFNCSRDTEKQPTAKKYYLIDGVPSLNVVDLHRTTTITSDCVLNNTSYTDTLKVKFNYSTGIVTTDVDSALNGKTSCISKYKTPLATTISDHESIYTLFEGWGIDVSEANKMKTGLIETDCPQQVATTDEAPTCKVTSSDQFIITDDTGKLHTIEKKLSIEKKSS